MVNYIDRIRKKCPVWDEAEKYYSVNNAGENLKSRSTQDETGEQEEEGALESMEGSSNDRDLDGSGAGKYDVVIQDVPRRSGNNSASSKRVFDPYSFEDDKKIDKTVDEALEKDTQLRQKKVYGELVHKFFDSLNREQKDKGHKANLEKAKEIAQGLMNEDI